MANGCSVKVCIDFPIQPPNYYNNNKNYKKNNKLEFSLWSGSGIDTDFASALLVYS